MNETINWQTMPDKEKIRPILVHVMGCAESDSLYALDIEKYPVAVYVDHLETWFLEEGNSSTAKEFDPLRDLNDAMLIIEKLETPTTLNYVPGFIPQHPKGRFPYYECEIVELDYGWGNHKIGRAFARKPSEAICIASLRWTGVHVTNVIEKLPAYQVTFEDGEKFITRDRQQAERELANREQQLKANLQWAVNVRKLKIEEVLVPEDYFNGPEMA